MTTYSRPNGTTYFANDPSVDPATGATIDAEINGIVSTINALDNANIANTPKIAGSKIDLTTSGYLPLSGGDVTGAINSIFDGVFRTMRATGNGRIREYRGSDGAIWGVSYNTYWNGSAWTGRDVTDICAVLKMESDGLHYYHAVSDATNVVPTWVELFHVDTSGTIVKGILGPQLLPPSAFTNEGVGDYILHTNPIERSTGSTPYVKVKETKISIAGTLRIKFDLKNSDGANTVYGKIYRNGSAVGTERTTISNTYSTFSEDITGWSAGDLVQVYAAVSGGITVYVQNLNICTLNPHIGGSLTGY